MASKAIALTLILSFALLGGYASIYTSHSHKFLDTLKVCTTPRSRLPPDLVKQKCILQAPSVDFWPTYVAVPEIDGLFAGLLEFFSQGLQKLTKDGVDLEALMSAGYMASHFGGAWCLIALEGLRLKNRGSILSWTGTFGIIFQLMTFTIISPIYYTLHLLLLSGTSSYQDVAADPLDLALIPVSTFISYVLPTLGLALPLLDVVSQEQKYILIAVWQFFPLYQTILQTALRSLFSSKGTSSLHPTKQSINSVRTGLGVVYRFVLVLSAGVHVVVCGTLLLSHFAPELLDVGALSPSRIMVPASLFNLPTLAVEKAWQSGKTLSAWEAREVVVSFLKWDIYCACGALNVWAAYLYLQGKQKQTQLGSIVVVTIKTAFWGLLGGPVAPAALMLWTRDTEALEQQIASLGKKRQ